MDIENMKMKHESLKHENAGDMKKKVRRDLKDFSNLQLGNFELKFSGEILLNVIYI